MPKMFKFFSLILALMLCFSAKLKAQDESEYQKWLQKEENEYQQFLQKEDREFADFLKQEWEAFHTNRGVKAFPRPKPVHIPEAPKKPQPKPPVPLKTIEKLPPPPPAPRPVKPKPAPAAPQPTMLPFAFYSETVHVPKITVAAGLDLNPPITNIKLSNAWKVFASSDQSKLIEQLKKERNRLALNDWGFVRLVHQTARQLLPGQANASLAFTWFLLNKMGYDAKVAFRNDRLFLLMPSQNTIYEQPFVVINQHKYYFIAFSERLNLSGKIFTYRKTYPGAQEALLLSIGRLPRLPQTVKKRVVRFTYAGKNYTIPIEYDAEQVRFFKDYPQTELKLYFQAPASSYLNYSLLTSLRALVKGKTELDAVNLLLRFVQKGFAYKTDDEQFGREKYMLPDETVSYPACDCEDRAVLFSYLVRHLLGLEVVGLDYPNHISTAVRFHAPVPGQSVKVNGRRFVICDPTYMNANAGMEMPEFEHVQPKIIVF